jgi:hypothetical protein
MAAEVWKRLATVRGLVPLQRLLGVGCTVSVVTQFLDQTPLACQGFFTFRRGCLEKFYSACEFAIHARCNARRAPQVAWPRWGQM